ncbi:MAG: hypothetical protein IT176_11340 [Acidobacteria bacterium]|nr:hypothetical protein [Acidobacteriota bacterium]
MSRRTAAIASLALLAAAALAIRALAWHRLGGPIEAVDSGIYRAFAQAMARGDFSEVARLPFYALYPLTLAPMYAWRLPEPGYLAWLHVLASAGTVLVLWRIGTGLMGDRAGLLLGAAAAIYPFFLFWLPYVLTETLFLFCLALYVQAYLTALQSSRAGVWIWYWLAALAFAVSRPSAVVCLVFSWLVLGAARAARRWGTARGVVFALAAALVVATGATAVVAASPAARVRLLSIPTIGQTLWASTKYATGTIEELRELEALDQEMHRRFSGADRERREYAFKVQEAAGFISSHPLIYLGMAGRKMVAFWLPWAFAHSWSAAHRAIDALATIGLTLGALICLTRRPMAPWPLAALLAMIASFVLLSAFGQIDPDARYRLPAELLVLILAAGGGESLLRERCAPAAIESRPERFSPTMHCARRRLPHA